jgi:ComF family protein
MVTAAPSKMLDWARACAAAGLDLVYPPECAVCRADLPADRTQHSVCEHCVERLVGSMPMCRRCAAPLPEAWADSGCPRCALWPFQFQSAVALNVYDGALRDCVLRMKRAAGRSLAAAIGELLGRHRAEAMRQFAPELIVPVPMHWLRRLRRGINSPDVLAGVIGRMLAVPVAGDLLYWKRSRPLQMELSSAQRRRNVRGALAVRSSWNLRDARVLVVDDVLTTGATCNAAARALRRAGATAVAVALAARTVLP